MYVDKYECHATDASGQRMQPRTPRTVEPQLGVRFVSSCTAAVSILLEAVSSAVFLGPALVVELVFY